MKEIITVQHCQSQQHINKMIGGATDWPLTELGIRQAHRIGLKLSKQLGTTAYIMYTSDLLRSRQTAEIISKYLKTTPIYRKELREQDFGIATGKSQEWFKTNQFKRQDDIPLIYHRPIEDAETGEEVYDRVSIFVEELYDSEEEKIIVIGHGGSLQMFTASWLKIPVSILENTAFISSAGGVSFMGERQDKSRMLNVWNDTSYMR